jgi:hypothetical protein
MICAQQCDAQFQPDQASVLASSGRQASTLWQPPHSHLERCVPPLAIGLVAIISTSRITLATTSSNNAQS